MASLRELRRKIKSVKSTQQITKAMKMVAAARLRKAQQRILSARPFAQKMEDFLSDILAEIKSAEEARHRRFHHPLLAEKQTGSRGLLLLTADKGLCGGFNANLIKKALEFLRQNEGVPVTLFCAGRKGRDFFFRLKMPLAGEYLNIYNKLSFVEAEVIGEDVMRFFLEGGRDVTIIYNGFKSVIQQDLTCQTLLPLSPRSVREHEVEESPDVIYEPDQKKLLDALFPRYLKAQIFRALLESAAAELGARMSAMENATRNASELIDGLSLTANKIRQAAITKEISEIVAGAESLA